MSPQCIIYLVSGGVCPFHLTRIQWPEYLCTPERPAGLRMLIQKSSFFWTILPCVILLFPKLSCLWVSTIKCANLRIMRPSSFCPFPCCRGGWTWENERERSRSRFGSHRTWTIFG